MSSNIKISYFNVKALAEPTRMLFKYGDVEFTDSRFEKDAWPDIKPNMPFGQVPILEVDGKTAHQSVALARYAAKKVNLVGETDWENLEIDSMVDTINDFRGKIAIYSYEQDPTIKESRKEPLFKEIIPYYMEKFEQIAKQNNGHFALGKLTWADFYFAGLLDYLNFMTGTNLIENYPNLQKVVESVTSNPNVQAWIESRPKTDL